MPSTLACFWIREDCYFWSCNWGHKWCPKGKIIWTHIFFCLHQVGSQGHNLGISVLVFIQGQEADGRLPYWLSNTSALLCLLQRNLRSNGLFATPSRRSGALGLGGKLVQVRNSNMSVIISIDIESILVTECIIIYIYKM